MEAVDSGPVSAASAGTVRLAGRDVARMGYGAMRLPGPRVWGPPPDRNAAIGVVRRAFELGVRVIDTAWYYGPEVAHRILAEALSPYSDDLVLVTKLGGARRDDGTWYADLSASGLRRGCEHDLRLLGLNEVPVTHLRWDDDAGVPFEDALETMLELQKEGKIRHLGLSNVSLGQLELAMTQAQIVTVSNAYSVTDRSDDAVVDRCTAHTIPYLPYFPLAIGKVTDHSPLLRAAEQLGATPAQVALAWLLSRSPVMLPIPGTAAPGGECSRRQHIAAGRDVALVARTARGGRPRICALPLPRPCTAISKSRDRSEYRPLVGRLTHELAQPGKLTCRLLSCDR